MLVENQRQRKVARCRSQLKTELKVDSRFSYEAMRKGLNRQESGVFTLSVVRIQRGKIEKKLYPF